MCLSIWLGLNLSSCSLFSLFFVSLFPVYLPAFGLFLMAPSYLLCWLAVLVVVSVSGCARVWAVSIGSSVLGAPAAASVPSPRHAGE